MVELCRCKDNISSTKEIKSEVNTTEETAVASEANVQTIYKKK